MSLPEFIVTNNTNEADTLFNPDGDPYLKAAGRAIAGTGSLDDSAPHLVEDATLLTGHGYKAIAVTGTAVALRGSATPCVRVTVKTKSGNAATVYVGLTGVTNDTNNTTGGLQLEPGEGFTFGVDDVASVFINGTSGDGASFAYET